MKFWDIFKSTAYFRASWYIQDLFINAFKDAKSASDDAKMKNSIIKNKGVWSKKLYDNEFHKNRRKK